MKIRYAILALLTGMAFGQGQFSGGGGGSTPTAPCGDSAHALSWTGTAYGCQGITGAGLAGGSSGQLQWNNATAEAGISQWTTNGTTTITGSATAVLDLHLAASGGLLLPGGLTTGIVKVTTGTGAITIATAPTGAIVGTTDTQALTNKDLTGAGNTFPTFNQNTTGSAVSFTGNLAGDATGAQGATVVGKINGVSMAGLATGILKNTNGTGVPSIAVAGDFPTLNQTTSGTAAALTSTPTNCGAGVAAIGILANGNATGCFTPGGLSNPMTTVADIIVGGASGAANRLAAPTATNGVPQFLVSTPSGGVGVTPAWAPAGVPTNAQTGTTYTVAATDRASYLTFSNAGAIAVTLPQAGTTGFASNFVAVGCDIGAGTATITPTTSTISSSNGSAYTSAASTLALTTGQCAWIYSDNTNYFAIVRTGGAGTVTSVATTGPITGGTITGAGTIACATCTTSAASLTLNQLLFGAGSQGMAVGDLTGDVTTAGGKATTIGANAVTLAKMATQANATVLSNVSGGTAVPSANALPTTANALIKTSNANGALASSLTTDDGTTSTYTGTGGTKSPVFTATGTTAGFADYAQGTTSTAVAPCNTANSHCIQAATAVTAGVETQNGVYAAGVAFLTGTSAAVQDNYSGSFGAVSQTAKTAAVTTFTVCAATANTACGQVGQYRLTYNVWGSGTACSSVTAGSVVLNLTWTDENATAHTTINVPMWDQKTGAMTAGQTNFNTALGTEGGSGSFNISTNGTIIQAATTYTACTTGTGTYNVRITTEQLQ